MDVNLVVIDRILTAFVLHVVVPVIKHQFSILDLIQVISSFIALSLFRQSVLTAL